MTVATPKYDGNPFVARRRKSWQFLDLALVCVAFAAVHGIFLRFSHDGLTLQDTAVGCAGSAAAFWLATQLKSNSGEEESAVVLLEQFCFGAGVSLLVHAFITYGLLTRQTPFLVMGSCVASAVLVLTSRRLWPVATPVTPRVLFVGFDGLTKRLVQAMHQPLAGIWGHCEAEPPEGVTVIGVETSFETAVDRFRPTHIVMGIPACEQRIPGEVLLRCRLAGIRVTNSASLYEKLFGRICCERLEAVDLVLSSALRGDSRTMAIQAVYNNVIGLAILLAVSPVLLLIMVAILLTSGKGPALESTQCAGFQYIPFRLQRFRTTRADGSRTTVGRVVRWLRLVNLPQLINVVRGDMALVGPRPVRSEFAGYLSAQMPFYAYRFSVKPGFGGWAQMHQAGKPYADTRREIEYDLYYIKEGSLWLDLEILLDRLLGGAMAGRNAAADRS
jgi:lipopolysaccharide/colanic/teichoic acid biosynthesis glycosyltransferase